MDIISGVKQWQDYRRHNKFSDKKIGFVPTMGNLHAGHASLLEKSKAENDITILSIFINPTQFNNQDDFDNYPQTVEQDLELAKNLNVDAVFIPDSDTLYSDDYKYQVSENDFSMQLCGKYRPGHFTGVLTIVLKLLMLVKPQKLYLGEKDFQQLHLIKGMLDSLFVDIEVVGCPIKRDVDGLALSSRNSRLTTDERKLASRFPELLSSDLSDKDVSESLTKLGFAVDYIETHNGRRFGAVQIGKVRLIDNTEEKL